MIFGPGFTRREGFSNRKTSTYQLVPSFNALMLLPDVLSFGSHIRVLATPNSH